MLKKLVSRLKRFGGNASRNMRNVTRGRMKPVGGGRGGSLPAQMKNPNALMRKRLPNPMEKPNDLMRQRQPKPMINKQYNKGRGAGLDTSTKKVQDSVDWSKWGN